MWLLLAACLLATGIYAREARDASPATPTQAVYGPSPGQYVLRSEDVASQQLPPEYLGLLQQLVAQPTAAQPPTAAAVQQQPGLRQVVVSRTPDPTPTVYSTNQINQPQVQPQVQPQGRVQLFTADPRYLAQHYQQQAFLQAQPQRQPQQQQVVIEASPRPGLAPAQLTPSRAHSVHEARLRASLAGEDPAAAVQQLVTTTAVPAQQYEGAQVAQFLALSRSQQAQEQQLLLATPQPTVQSAVQQSYENAAVRQQASSRQPQQQVLYQRVAAQEPGLQLASQRAAQQEAALQQAAQEAALQQAAQQAARQQVALQRAEQQQAALQRAEQQQAALQRAEQQQQAALLRAQQEAAYQQAGQQAAYQRDEQQQTASRDAQTLAALQRAEQQQAAVQRATIQEAQDYQNYDQRDAPSPSSLQIRPPAPEQYLRETTQQQPRRQQLYSRSRPQETTAAPVHDDDVINSLLGQSQDTSSFYQTTGRPTSVESASPASRSSIFVSTSTRGKNFQNPSAAAESLQSTEAEEDKELPVVRLPTPEGQRPLTQSEFQALIAAGFRVSPVTEAKTPSPNQAYYQQQQLASTKRQRSYATPAPPAQSLRQGRRKSQKPQAEDYLQDEYLSSFPTPSQTPARPNYDEVPTQRVVYQEAATREPVYQNVASEASQEVTTDRLVYRTTTASPVYRESVTQRPVYKDLQAPQIIYQEDLKDRQIYQNDQTLSQLRPTYKAQQLSPETVPEPVEYVTASPPTSAPVLRDPYEAVKEHLRAQPPHRSRTQYIQEPKQPQPEVEYRYSDTPVEPIVVEEQPTQPPVVQQPRRRPHARLRQRTRHPQQQQQQQQQVYAELQQQQQEQLPADYSQQQYQPQAPAPAPVYPTARRVRGRRPTPADGTHLQ